MFGLGIWEVVAILVTALLILGPEKMPQVARQVARFISELKRVSDDVRRNFDDVLAEPTEVDGPAAPRSPPAGVQAAHGFEVALGAAASGATAVHKPQAGVAAQTGAEAGAGPRAATQAGLGSAAGRQDDGQAAVAAAAKAGREAQPGSATTRPEGDGTR